MTFGEGFERGEEGYDVKKEEDQDDAMANLQWRQRFQDFELGGLIEVTFSARVLCMAID